MHWEVGTAKVGNMAGWRDDAGYGLYSRQGRQSGGGKTWPNNRGSSWSSRWRHGSHVTLPLPLLLLLVRKRALLHRTHQQHPFNPIARRPAQNVRLLGVMCVRADVRRGGTGTTGWWLVY